MLFSTPTFVGACFLTLASSSIQVSIPNPANDTGHPGQCKPVPGTPDWPSPEAWSKLNSTLNGALLAPLPPAAVCDSSKPVYSNASCSAVSTSWFNSSFHADDPVSVDWPNWQGDACLPPVIYNESKACDEKEFPSYVVNATVAQHVSAAVKFAAKTGVRLVVKGTGHDFLGRSTSPSSLSIWTRHLLGIKVDTSFTPTSCKKVYAQPAVTIAAGQRWGEVYKEVAKHNMTVVGGADPNVGLGGWLTGGGHSPISSKYGLGVDNVLEMEIVTPKGDVVVANGCENSDLFWAMRGGGGSTFGVLLSATMKLHPDQPISNILISINATSSTARKNDNAAYYSTMSLFHASLPSYSAADLAGYFFLYPISNSGSGGATATSDNFSGAAANATGPPQLAFAFFGWSLLGADANATRAAFEPLLAHAKAGGLDAVLYVTPAPSFNAFLAANIQPGAVGVNGIMTSRLWDERAISDRKGVESTLRVFKKDSLQGLFVSGPGVRGVDANAAAVTPAWRTSYVHMLNTLSPPPATLASEHARLTHVLGRALRERAPESGAYLNESDRDEPEWQQAWWGENYERLLRLKRRWDPKDVFWCEVCVGGERWREREGRVCKV